MAAYINDMTQFTDMRRLAENNRQEGLREVAQQFEALFLQTMLKSMRDASPGDSMFGDSNAHNTYTGMYDQQLALNMAERGGLGLADVLVRQLGAATPASGNEPVLRASATTESAPRVTGGWSSAESFVRDIWPHARKAANALGVAPAAVVAQAALETGWGKHIASDARGDSSLNLFGIKAGQRWGGKSVTQPTLEFRQGIAQRETAKFRAYDSLEQTFADYTEFLTSKPRYSNVQGHGEDIDAFARALQASGYATDPEYAHKIRRIAGSKMMARALEGLKL